MKQELNALFPGAVGLSRVGVYDWDADDGVCGGSPHMHTASTEAYLVLAGTGRLETIRSSGYESHDLAPNDLLWFSPGTIHRLVNQDNLEILVIMQNAGLPEAGDAVLTFEADILASPERYAKAATLTADRPGASESSARIRRDAALAGYQRLKEASIAGQSDAVEQFHRHAVRLVQSRVPGWQTIWEETIAPEAARTGAWLTEVSEGRFRHLANATVARSEAGGQKLFGMCGMLQKWDTGQLI
jgi:mannose-6-phosphate isomerase-like protein (cupin superfamily)